ncbi:MAG: amidohydrolase family protein [Armatimonadetes bacterium]|nr:amidohydrolase family protein [Armatimonadota bacterium]
MSAIDFHCHYGNWGGEPYPEGSPERILDLFARHGVSGALISPLNALFSGCADHGAENDRVFKYCSRAPGRLFAAMTVNPLMGQAALAEIRRCKTEHDVKVLKLHPWLQGFPIASPEMDSVAALCRGMGIAIMFHDGTPMYTHPLQLARLCRDFPGLTVISGHSGLGDLWREAMLAAQRYPDFILCLCGPREAAMREIVGTIPPEQICVGSDFFASNADDCVIWFRWASFRAVEIREETRRIIEVTTPLRILGCGT